jgi:IS5 family transposase
LLKFVLSALGVQSVANRRSTANADREYGLALSNYALRLKAEGRAADQATFDKKMAQARLATQVFESLARSLSSSGHGNKAKGLDLQSFIRLRQQVKDRMVEEATRRDPNDPWATKPMPTEQEINDAVETEVKQSRSLLENSPEGQALMNSTQFGSLGERDEAVVRMKIALFLRMAGKPSDMGSVTQVLQNPGMLVEILNGIEEYEFGPVR